jgi:hypothetical protein
MWDPKVAIEEIEDMAPMGIARNGSSSSGIATGWRPIGPTCFPMRTGSF